MQNDQDIIKVTKSTRIVNFTHCQKRDMHALEKFCCPIGLHIGAKISEEISFSIIEEMINVRANLGKENIVRAGSPSTTKKFSQCQFQK